MPRLFRLALVPFAAVVFVSFPYAARAAEPSSGAGAQQSVKAPASATVRDFGAVSTLR